MVRPVFPRYIAEVRALVEAPSSKRYRERLQLPRRLCRRVVQDRRRVQPPGCPNPQRYVRNQMLPHRIPQQPVQFVLRRPQRDPPLRSLRDLPPCFAVNPPLPPFQQVPRRYLPDPTDQRLRPRHVVQRQVRIQRVQIQLPSYLRMLQDGLQFRSEVEFIAVATEVQRLDPHPVAHQHQPLIRLRPQRHREHTAHPRKTRRVPLQVRPQHRLRIAVRAETVTQTLQLGSNFLVVVDFSVEDYRRIPVVTQDRLVSALQIDDLQAYRAQRRFAAFEDTLLVRPAMRNRFRDALGNACAVPFISTRKPRDSTHLTLYPRFLPICVKYTISAKRKPL